MNQLKRFEDILTSNHFVKDFHELYMDEEFKQWLLSVLPEIGDCEKQEQDNPWHIYDCLNHILHSVQNINILSKNQPQKVRKMLALVMFLHDIGKPACHIRRYAQNYGRDVDSFFDHNKKSAEITARVLNDFRYSGKDAKTIEKLVLNHDIFMFIRLKPSNSPFRKVLNDEVFESEIQDLNTVGDGTLLMKYLLMIGRADSSAQNPEMTKGSFEVLDAMEAMLKKYQSKEKS